MIIPHLLFAHLVGDYLLQTNWLAVRKSQALDGLLLHGLIIYLISLLATAPYFEAVFLPITLLFVVHTFQDWLKVWSGPRLRVHLAYGYFIDQGLHLLLILGIQMLVDVDTPHAEVVFMSLGAALIAVTRFYEVSWWANWFEMIIHMNRWQVWGDVERVMMLLAAMLGPVPALVSPIFALPRLYYAWRIGNPLWKERYGLLEWGLGIVFSLCLGYFGLFQIMQ
ncbi:MAG: DUF3307 domain-containing protein [Anaerolineae bacterium]|nr:DUF3307 domain-containing protein [Anaerolineae bacterium]